MLNIRGIISNSHVLKMHYTLGTVCSYMHICVISIKVSKTGTYGNILNKLKSQIIKTELGSNTSSDFKIRIISTICCPQNNDARTRNVHFFIFAHKVLPGSYTWSLLRHLSF